MPNGYTAQQVRCLACILLLLQVYLRFDLTLGLTRLIVLDHKCSEGIGRIDMLGFNVFWHQDSCQSFS
jgi:hypothetical protein